MNPSKKNRLFKKYMSGDISKEEMHELNLLALEDDFLFDALEGSSAFEESNRAAIQELGQRLNQKVNHKRKPLIFWLTGAAAIIVILIAAVFLINPLEEELSSQIAMQDEANEEVSFQDSESQEQAIFATKPSASSENDLAEGQEKNTSSSVRKENTSVESTKEDLLPSAEPVEIENQAEETGIEDIVESVEQVNRQNNLVAIPAEASPQSENDASVEAFANDASITKEITKKEDVQGIHVTSELTDVQLEPRNTLTLNEEERKAKSKAANSFVSVTQSPRSKSQSKIVNDERSKKRSSKESPDIISKLKVSITNDDENSRVLQQYINKNLSLKLRQFDFKADFTIRNQNEVVDFKVTKSAGKSLDGELRSLIESFQEWRTLGNKEIRITIN